MTFSLRLNSPAGNAHRQLLDQTGQLDASLRRLSSGQRIERAADAPGELRMLDRLTAQVRGLQAASAGAQDAIALLNTADAALEQVGQMLQRMRELSLQAANGTAGKTDRADANAELQDLKAEINAIAANTTFNGLNLLKAGNTTFTFTFGPDAKETFKVKIGGASASRLKVNGIKVNSQANAEKALTRIDMGLAIVDGIRGTLGAATNRLQWNIQRMQVAGENESAARSQVRDVDVAAELARLSRRQIQAAASTAVLAQANAQPVQLLGLFLPPSQ